MDPRRFLTLLAAGLLVSGCAVLRPGAGQSTITPTPTAFARASLSAETVVSPSLAPEPPPEHGPVSTLGAGEEESPSTPPGEPSATLLDRGEAAPVETPGTEPVPDRRVGVVQVFGWSPGRSYPVRTAPLRVTTLTLAVGETLVAKAAGDTVRWQIGETTSGSGSTRRTHVLLKPLERGLETNLVLTTDRRVYFLDLRSGPVSVFDPAVAWDDGASEPEAVKATAAPDMEPVRIADPVVAPQGPLDARYRIAPQGRRPRWTPATVFNDGRRTFIAFGADLAIDEAPALFVIAPDGERQMVNYRQAGGLFVVDRVFDRAELRLGDRHPEIVRLQRLGGDHP